MFLSLCVPVCTQHSRSCREVLNTYKQIALSYRVRNFWNSLCLISLCRCWLRFRFGPCRLRYNSDFIIYFEWFQRLVWVTLRGRRWRWRRSWRLLARRLLLHHPLCNHRVGWINMIFELFIHPECCCADSTFIGQVCRFQWHWMISCNVVQKFPLVYSTTNWTTPTIPSLVSSFLHTWGYKTMWPK